MNQIPSLDYPKLADEYGTPLYIYDGRIIRHQFEALREQLRSFKHSICYAMKANSNISVLKYVARLGGGFDIVSEGELRRVLRATGDASNVVFSGVGKKKTELEFALNSGIKLFNVESRSEAEALESVARAAGRKVAIALRINPNISVETHRYLATGLKTSKFGIPVDEARELGRSLIASEWLELAGVDCHIGSQINQIDALRQAYTEVLDTARFFEDAGASIRYIDLGGGLAVSYSGHYTPLDLAAFGEMLRSLPGLEKYEVIFEPGKFLVAESGSLLSRVITVKSNDERNFVIIDAGMNDLLRPALYEAHHDIVHLGSAGAPAKRPVDIVGPVCETGCYLGKDRILPELHEGDLILIKDSGAYSFAMASTYNSRRLPAEVLLDENGIPTLIRRRDEYEDLWKNEILID